MRRYPPSFSRCFRSACRQCAQHAPVGKGYWGVHVLSQDPFSGFLPTGPELHAATASAAADASTTPGRASAAADAAASASGGPGRPTYVGTAGRESAGGNSNASCSADSGRARNVLDAECAGMIVLST